MKSTKDAFIEMQSEQEETERRRIEEDYIKFLASEQVHKSKKEFMSKCIDVINELNEKEKKSCDCLMNMYKSIADSLKIN